jgi:hypothetical protein
VTGRWSSTANIRRRVRAVNVARRLASETREGAQDGAEDTGDDAGEPFALRPESLGVEDHPALLQLPPAAADAEPLVAGGVADFKDVVSAARLVLGDLVGADAGREAGEGGAEAVDRFGGEVLGVALDIHADAGLGLVSYSGEEVVRRFSHGLSGVAA